MHTLCFDTRVRLAAGAALLAVLLGGCARSAPPAETPAAAAGAAAPAPEVADAASGRGAGDASPSPPVASASKPAVAAAAGPELASMKLATASSKLGVPVDLRYRFDGEVRPGQPVTLHLAAVPRVAGSNLAVSIKEDAGIRTDKALTLNAQKAGAATAYREQLSVTRLAGGPPELRVLVTMDLPEGSAFGYFGVPFDGVEVP